MKKVLLVDDDDLVRPTVGAMLAALEFEVVESATGSNALKLMSEIDFDLIITDLFMPEIDGIELILQLQKIAPTTPIILMTGGGRLFPQGSASLDVLTKSAAAIGASFVINKPFRKADLAKVLDDAMP